MTTESEEDDQMMVVEPVPAKPGQGDFDRAQIICIIGGPGVGKGTQCKKLARDLNAVHMSVGDLLRAEAESILQKHKVDIYARMKDGVLVPTEIVQETLGLHLLKNLKAGRELILLDGFPRSMEQATRFRECGFTIKGVLFFDGSVETLRERMFGRAKTLNRVDDNDETFAKRCQGFAHDSEAIIAHFEAQKKLHKVNCERPLHDAALYDEIRTLVKEIWSSTPSHAEETMS
ncbi:hypothetical protein N7G274_009134 [Stereocaulon virgatum]|uniref:Adenylate kinase n=1 Tax=Stereocaulon virgatum TaxID=373712 RepID=A0ABR3ZYV5_9LECA